MHSAHRMTSTIASLRPRRQQAVGLEDQARRQRAGGVGGEQHAVVEIDMVVAEIGGEFGHLRLIGIAETKDDAAASSVIDTTMRLPAISRAVANTPAKPPSASRARPAAPCANARSERRLPQPPGQRHVDQDVDQHAERRAEGEQHRAADRGTAEQAERARHRHQPHRAVQVRRVRRCRGSEAATPAPRTRRPCRER